MKRLIVTSLMLCTLISISAFSQTNVSSVNIVGYTKLSVPGGGKYTIVAVPFDSLGSSNLTFTLDQLIGTNMTAGDSTIADQIIIWNGVGYDRAFLNNADWEDPAIDNKWCYKVGNNLGACATNASYKITPGKGFWYQGRGTNFLWTTTRPYNF